MSDIDELTQLEAIQNILDEMVERGDAYIGPPKDGRPTYQLTEQGKKKWDKKFLN